MKAKELLEQLQELSPEELELEVQLIAGGTIGCPVFDEISVCVDENYFNSVSEQIDLGKVVALYID